MVPDLVDVCTYLQYLILGTGEAEMQGTSALATAGP